MADSPPLAVQAPQGLQSADGRQGADDVAGHGGGAPPQTLSSSSSTRAIPFPSSPYRPPHVARPPAVSFSPNNPAWAAVPPPSDSGSGLPHHPAMPTLREVHYWQHSLLSKERAQLQSQIGIDEHGRIGSRDGQHLGKLKRRPSTAKRLLPVVSIKEPSQMVFREENFEEQEDYVAGAWQTFKDSTEKLSARLQNLCILIFMTLEFPQSSRCAKHMSQFLIGAIVVNTVVVFLGAHKLGQEYPSNCTHPLCDPASEGALCKKIICHPIESPPIFWLTAVTVIIFTLDYLLRLVTVHAVNAHVLESETLAFDLEGRLKRESGNGSSSASPNTRERGQGGLMVSPDPHSDPHPHPFLPPLPPSPLPTTTTTHISCSRWRKTWKFATSWFSLIDLVSILPFYITVILVVGCDVAPQEPGLQLIRVLQILRVLKLLRYSEYKDLFVRTIQDAWPAIRFFFYLVSLVILIFGMAIFHFEMGTFMVTEEHPDGAFYRENVYHDGLEVTPFSSILSGIFWAVVNTTTLKYAIAPTSFGGRLIAIVLSYISIFMVALPIPIVAKSFTKQYSILYPDQNELLMLGGPSLDATAAAAAARKGVAREIESSGSSNNGSDHQSGFADGGRGGGCGRDNLPVQS